MNLLEQFNLDVFFAWDPIFEKERGVEVSVEFPKLYHRNRRKS